jgi:hypothetical protein
VRARRAFLFFFFFFCACASLTGCIERYHPDYHPVSSYEFEQRVTYPRTVVRVPDPPNPPSPPDLHEPTAEERHVAPPPPPRADSAPASPWAGVWYEHVEGTVCDRQIAIEESDDVPYARVTGCGGGGDSKLRTVSYESGGVWRLRRQWGDGKNAWDVTGDDTLDYRLRRKDGETFCGTLVAKPLNEKAVTHAVCWTRVPPPPPETPDGVPPWLMGRWEGDAYQMAIVNEGGTLRLYRRWNDDSHFDARPMKLLDFESGMVRLETKEPWGKGAVDEFRLRLAKDGSLQGVVVWHPPPGDTRHEAHLAYEEQWTRPR